MNLAFTTVLLFILLAPGYLARRAYKSSKLSVKVLNKNVVNELTWSIIPALTLHIIFIAVIHNFTDYYIDFQQLGNLLLGTKETNDSISTFQKIGDFKYAIFFYNLAIFIVSFFVGYLSREIIRATKLDIKVRYFRFTNKWHYIFSGECLDFPDVPDHYEEITDKIVNILCRVNDKNVLYTGEFFNYYIDPNGNLEAVHLRNPIRRYLEKDDGDVKDYYVIPSRFLIIPNADIININFRYFALEEISEKDLKEQEKINYIESNKTSD